MSIELPSEIHAEAVASLKAYCDEHLEEPLGNLAVSALLDYVIEEIGPTLYNKGVADAQERLHARVAELDIEVHEDEFPHARRR